MPEGIVVYVVSMALLVWTLRDNIGEPIRKRPGAYHFGLSRTSGTARC